MNTNYLYYSKQARNLRVGDYIKTLVGYQKIVNIKREGPLYSQITSITCKDNYTLNVVGGKTKVDIRIKKKKAS